MPSFNPKGRRITPGYAAVLLAACLLAVAAGWTDIAARMDGEAYDWVFRSSPAAASSPTAIVVAFDDASITAMHGMQNLRGTLAQVLNQLSTTAPRAVAIDIILADESETEQDAALEKALANSRNVILASDLLESGGWQSPAKRFRAHSAALGHVHAAPDPVSRVLPLEVSAAHDRRWAMALETFRLVKGADAVVEEPHSLDVGDTRIPGERELARRMYIRYRADVPVVPVRTLLGDPQAAEAARGKAVFVGVTSQSAAHDRLLTPLDRMMTGVEMHAQAFETLMAGSFLAPAGNSLVVLICAVISFAAGAIFVLSQGWAAYLLGAGLIAGAHWLPHYAFSRNVVLPHLAPAFAAWLSVVSAAGWQYFVVRKQLRKSESDKARYQQAIHFVTHEMRSPLTAIQGSSELMGRYPLTEDKRKQMAQMINSESKRLAKMIQTFLDIERLADGQVDLKPETFAANRLLQSCVDRAVPLADRKEIEIHLLTSEDLLVHGDRELMEYAVYNLLTNAIKYSPAGTKVTAGMKSEGGSLRLFVEDQGIGMDEKEIRSIFRKFYRTKKAESSGEAGTGIGLSIVDQIVSHHGGRIEVTSVPGKGSCFTMVLPAAPASKMVTS